MIAVLKRLREHKGGVALMEFAFIFPIVIVLAMTGSELTNYITTRMRVSQIALQLADNAARMGNGNLLSAKTISETDINDVFIGAQMQSGEIDIKRNGRIILSDLEPMANPNTTSKYKIAWQRCYGNKTSKLPGFGTAGQTDLDGMGPTNQKVTATDDNATMFVEVYYVYKPLIGLGTLAPSTTMTEIASMSVRDRRDLSRIYNSEGATVSSC